MARLHDRLDAPSTPSSGRAAGGYHRHSLQDGVRNDAAGVWRYARVVSAAECVASAYYYVRRVQPRSRQWACRGHAKNASSASMFIKYARLGIPNLGRPCGWLKPRARASLPPHLSSTHYFHCDNFSLPFLPYNLSGPPS